VRSKSFDFEIIFDHLFTIERKQPRSGPAEGPSRAFFGSSLKRLRAIITNNGRRFKPSLGG